MTQSQREGHSHVAETKIQYHRGRAELPTDPRYERLVAMIVGLTSQVSVLSERLATFQRLAERKGLFTREDVESYTPSEEELVQRAKSRTHLIETVFNCVEQDLALLGGKK
nr:MAG: hypothetical protein DIU57_06685 [Pseudomonadota bacterium]